MRFDAFLLGDNGFTITTTDGSGIWGLVGEGQMCVFKAKGDALLVIGAPELVMVKGHFALGRVSIMVVI